MTFDLSSLFPDLEALTPDGRWNLLQEWLRDNPEHQEQVERWASQTPEEAFISLRLIAAQITAKKYGAIAGMVVNAAPMNAQSKRIIEILQTCYRERAGHTSGWMQPDNDPRPTAHKTIHDRQQQLKAKRKRKRK